MKILKYILGIAILIIISIIGFGIYFVGKMSSTYPPIETYNLNYSKSQFEKKLNEIKFKNDYELTFTDTTGIDKDTELNYYFNIIDKRSGITNKL
jgi:ATP-dependent Zn protease